MNPVYLGDSVYAEGREDGSILLYLNNGDGPKNEIVLDGYSGVIHELVKYARVAGWKFGDDPK